MVRSLLSLTLFRRSKFLILDEFLSTIRVSDGELSLTTIGQGLGPIQPIRLE